MTTLAHSLERTLTIRAAQDTVFRFFTDSACWASWWGAGSTIDARPGGALLIRHPNGVEATGEVLEIAPPERIVFTLGYASGTPIPPGGSRVTILVEPHGHGSVLTLTHEFPDAAGRDSHLQGWRYQLSMFANVVLRELTAQAAETIDAWFAAWSITNAAARRTALERVVNGSLRYRDRYSALEGLDDLVIQIGAVQQYMPEMRLARTGAMRDCQGVVLTDWTASAADGQPRASGTASFAFGSNGRLDSVISFWN
jgi:uncharacterized protein YndB with AHSA1/START domain